MLTIAEEVLILLLNDGDDVVFTPVPYDNLSCALAGAVLMDLSFAQRIDMNPERLVVIDPMPAGNAILDNTLAKLAARDPHASAGTWIGELSVRDAARIHEAVQLSLVARGVLALREGSFLWTYRVPRLPWIGSEAEREVKGRIRDILFSDGIPEPRDVALIGLTDACDLIGSVFPDGDMGRYRPRIDQLRRMDLIARELADLTADIGRRVMSIRSESATERMAHSTPGSPSAERRVSPHPPSGCM